MAEADQTKYRIIRLLTCCRSLSQSLLPEYDGSHILKSDIQDEITAIENCIGWFQKSAECGQFFFEYDNPQPIWNEMPTSIFEPTRMALSRILERRSHANDQHGLPKELREYEIEFNSNFTDDLNKLKSAFQNNI